MNNSEQKRGRGRPAGSQSFVTVSLAELNSMFDSGKQIQIGRLWLEQHKTDNVVATKSKPVSQQSTAQAVEMILSE